MARCGLFWQFPVVTEKAFAEQHRGRPGFVAFPWATAIDRGTPQDSIYAAWAALLPRSPLASCTAPRYTCCQHIHFRRLAPLFRRLGIRTVYAAHCARGETRMPGAGAEVRVLPCALFAVNVEDELRGRTFRTLSALASSPSRPLLFSFVGAYQPSNYLSDIRPRIFDTWADLPKPRALLASGGCGPVAAAGAASEGEPDIWVEDTGRSWHFQGAVYDRKRQDPRARRDAAAEEREAEVYTRLLFLSRFSLCPSGSGPNSIRLWESLAAGAIPVILSDRLELPPLPALLEGCVRRPEGANLRELEAELRAMPAEEVARRRALCLEAYARIRGDLAGEAGPEGDE